MDLAATLFPRLGPGPGPEERERWAASGAMALTGHPDRRPLLAPGGVVAGLDHLGRMLADRSGRLGRTVALDAVALLGERAALSGLSRQGRVSCGGAARIVTAADGWIAANLARPEDVELVPAWLELDEPVAAHDPWPAIEAAVATRAAAQVVRSGGDIGLPVARQGEVDRTVAVRAHMVGTPTGARPTAPDLLVVDLSALWAGPLCGQLLTEAGLRVVKVESVSRPDGARSGPPAFFDLMNGGKQSVALDLRRPDGVSALRRLLLAADVVIEASRPRALEQLGIDRTVIAAGGQLQVWLSITAYGRDDGHRVGFGDDAAVAGGLVAHDGIGPVFCADAIADPITGLTSAVAVLDRLLDGRVWFVDVAMAGVAAALVHGPAPSAPWGGPIAPPRARATAHLAPPLGADTDVVLSSLPDPT